MAVSVPAYCEGVHAEEEKLRRAVKAFSTGVSFQKATDLDVFMLKLQNLCLEKHIVHGQKGRLGRHVCVGFYLPLCAGQGWARMGGARLG